CFLQEFLLPVVVVTFSPSLDASSYETERIASSPQPLTEHLMPLATLPKPSLGLSNRCPNRKFRETEDNPEKPGDWRKNSLCCQGYSSSWRASFNPRPGSSIELAFLLTLCRLSASYSHS